VKPLFGNPQTEAQRWYAKHKAVPINHLVVMRKADVAADPETAREVYRLLLEGKRRAGAPPSPDPLPFGIEANRPSLELIADYAYQQQLIPRPLSVDEMFEETRDLFGA
jgi:4,5-dihydroxyphthalate decarboxylase